MRGSDAAKTIPPLLAANLKEPALLSSKKNTDRRTSREAAFNVLFSQHFTELPLPTVVASVEATESVEALKQVREDLAAVIHASEAAIKSIEKSLEAIRVAANDEKARAKPTGAGLLQDRRWVVEARSKAEESIRNAGVVLRRTSKLFDGDSFASRLLQTFEQNTEKIDQILQKSLKGWTHDRLTAADGSVLRLGLTELLFFEDVPPKVVVNEYIELARAYGGDDAHKLVNAVLDRVHKENPREGEAAR